MALSADTSCDVILGNSRKRSALELLPEKKNPKFPERATPRKRRKVGVEGGKRNLRMISKHFNLQLEYFLFFGCVDCASRTREEFNERNRAFS